MIRLPVRGLVLAMCLMLPACAGTDLAPDKQKDLGAVSVDPAVKMPDKVFYNGPENNWGVALGGVLGAVIASEAVEEPTRIRLFMEKQKIDLGRMVADEFKARLAASPQFGGKLRDDASTRFELEVKIYGLAQKGAFSSQYKPLLRVDARLVDAGGNVLWKKFEFVTNLSSVTPGYTYPEYFETPPDKMLNAWSVAVKSVVGDLIEDLAPAAP
jgi:hypothetical protein